MTPAIDTTDSKLVARASRFQVRRLLEGGIRILHYQPVLLHQKVFTIDGVWCAIGSTNFDDRSFEINDEIMLGIADRGIARELEEIFERDAENCVELDLEAWKHRPVWDKVIDRFLYIFKEQF
jgi:cardiolipin synthase